MRTGTIVSRIAPAKAKPDFSNAGMVLALALFAGCLLFSINAVKIGLSALPLRTGLLLMAGGTIAVISPDLLRRALMECARAIMIITLFAVLGIFVSSVAGNAMGDVFRQILEIHLQAIIGIVIAYALCLHFGPKPVIYAFLAAYGLSAVFAVGQALGVNAAWNARALIGGWSNDSPITRIAYVTRYRALGLSFSPVLFATQSCLAFAAFYCLRVSQGGKSRFGFDPLILLAGLVIMILCVATGNRSPMLGLIIFSALYVLIRSPKAAILILPIAFIGLVAVQPLMDMLADAGVRAATTGDGSSEGRATLQKYGLFLLQSRPLGYGLTFESTEYWQSFANEVIYDPNPMAIRNWALHNYYLVLLGKYGVTALALIPLILPRTRLGWTLIFSFLPYAVHIFFHNDGPMQGDFLIFFVLAAFIYVSRQQSGESDDHSTADRRDRPWRRAFGSGEA